MSKRKKSPNKGRTGGGRVTPKGTRPGERPGEPTGWAALGEAMAGGSGGAGDQQFAGTGFDLGLGMPEGFDLGFDGPDERAAGDPFGPMVESFRELDLGDPLQVELWASDLVGAFVDEFRQAELRNDTPWDTGGDDLPSEAEFFYDFVGGLSRRIVDDEPEWAQLLAAIAPFLDSAAQSKAALDLEAVDPSVVAFAAPVGQAVAEEAFLLDHDTDDGHHVGLVARHPGAAEPHLVMAFIDSNLGGMASDILVSADVEGVRAEAASQGLVASPLEPAEAHARLQQALQRTDLTMVAPVEEDFPLLRPLLESVMRSLPEPSRLAAVEPPSDDELDAVVESIVEGSAEVFDDELTPERLRDTARLVTRFMSREMGRSPVAWSPARLEILLCDFVPRKVPVPPEALASLPAELAALVPAAQRLAGWEDRHVEFTLEMIERVTPEFMELVASDEVREPAKRLAMRAIEDDVDLEDPDAVAALVERMRNEGGGAG